MKYVVSGTRVVSVSVLSHSYRSLLHLELLPHVHNSPSETVICSRVKIYPSDPFKVLNFADLQFALLICVKRISCIVL